MVFSHPCIGTVGLSEQAAAAKFGAENLKVYKSTFSNLWYGPWQMEPEDKPKTAMKLVTTLPNEKVCTPTTHILAQTYGAMISVWYKLTIFPHFLLQ